MDLGDILGAQITDRFTEDEFPEFCRQLLECELERRHPSARVDGPPRPKVKDGNRDLVVTITGAPSQTHSDFLNALFVTDSPGEIWYSCRTGRTWEKNIERDFRGGPKKPLPADLLDHLAAGRPYVFLIDDRTGTARSMLAKVVARATLALRDRGTPSPLDLSSQFVLFDANHLASFIRKHRPTLASQFRSRLEGDVEPPGMRGFDAWTREFGHERSLRTFASDAAREALLGALARLPDDPDVITIAGPSGVGKTRVVHEGIQRLLRAGVPIDNVRYCEDADRTVNILRSPWLHGRRGIILVFDEVDSISARDLAQKFRAANPGRGSRLVLIGTAAIDDVDAVESMQAASVPPLDDASSRRLVADVLGEDQGAPSEAAASVIELAEGYPLFATYLAEALAIDGDAIQFGRAPTDEWSAAQRVLVGPHRHFLNEESWIRAAEQRARCLLAVIVAGEADWSGSEDEAMSSFLRIPWREILDEVEPARRRGLLRYAGTPRRKYVSPLNLIRIIINHFFDEPLDTGPRFDALPPDRRARLQRAASRVRASARARENLAKSELRLLRNAAPAEIVRAATSVLLAAEVNPEGAGNEAASAILALSPSELRSRRDVRAAVRPVLEHVVHRRISAQAFAGVERALLSMALVEDEPWANNATGIWTSLFLPLASQTHQGLAGRLSLLRRRAEDESADVRVLAIRAVAGAARSSERGLGTTERDRVDGNWSTEPRVGVLGAKAEAWASLVQLCSDRVDEVSGAARSTLASLLRSGVRIGLEVPLVRRLAVEATSWSPDEKRALTEALADIWRYDTVELDGQPELNRELEALHRSLAPTGLHERVVAQVGSWHPGPEAINDRDRRARERETDQRIAAEFLAEPTSFGPELEWLSSSRAVRARPFLWVVGEVDHSRSSLPALLDRCRKGDAVDLLVGYLAGWAHEQTTPTDVDVWMQSQLDDPAIESAIAAAIPLMPPSETRLELLARLMVTRSVRSRPIALRHASWALALPIPATLDFVRTCLGAGIGADVVDGMLLELLTRSDLSEADRAVALELLESCLRATARAVTSAAGDVDWQSGVEHLLEIGRVPQAVDILLDGLEGSSPRSVMAGQLLRKSLPKSDVGVAVWHAVAPRLQEPALFATHWEISRANLLAFLPATLVLDWIGDDTERGQLVAGLAHPYADSLDDMTRGLVRRFGADSIVGARLLGRVFETPSVVTSFTEFEREQLERARTWAKDDDAEVSNWASMVETALMSSISEAEARDEFERRYA